MGTNLTTEERQLLVNIVEDRLKDNDTEFFADWLNYDCLAEIAGDDDDPDDYDNENSLYESLKTVSFLDEANDHGFMNIAKLLKKIRYDELYSLNMGDGNELIIAYKLPELDKVIQMEGTYSSWDSSNFDTVYEAEAYEQVETRYRKINK